jgi:TrmH family RNA methyltransferase
MTPNPRTPILITSLQNDRVKLIRSLEMRKARKESGLFVAEGTSIMISAREAGWTPRMLVYRSDACEGIAKGLIDWALNAGSELLEVSEAVLTKIAAKDNPQSLIGVFAQRWSEPPAAASLPPTDTWLALEEIRDPGNLGTIVRTVDAVGARGIILVGTTCDPFAHECIRATMGSIFSVPVVRMQREAFLAWRSAWPGEVVGTHLSAREDFRSVAYRGPSLLVMGSEGPGLSTGLAAACDRLVRIPMAGKLDSLNLAVATALTLYQMRGAALTLS